MPDFPDINLVNLDGGLRLTDASGNVQRIRLWGGAASGSDFTTSVFGATLNAASGAPHAREILGVGASGTGGGSLTSGSVTSGFLGDGSVNSGSLASGAYFRRSVPLSVAGNPTLVSGETADIQVFNGSGLGLLYYNDTDKTIQWFQYGGNGLVRFDGDQFSIGGMVTSGEILSGCVGSIHLSSGAVRSGHVADAAVNSGNIGSGQVGPHHLSSPDLYSVANSSGVGMARRTPAGWVVRSVAGASGSIDVSDGDGASGDPTAKVASGYAGQASITWLGTVTSGVWGATPLASGRVGSGSVGGSLAGRQIASGTVGPLDIGSGAVRSGHVAANAVTNGNLRQSVGLSLIGRAVSGTGDVADIAAASDGQVMCRSGTAVGFGAIDLANTAAAAGIIPAASLPNATDNNALINGGFQFFQRQAPGTLTSRSDDTYGPDRWYVLTQTASVQVIRTTGSVSPYGGQLKQNQASAQRMGLAQIVESPVSIPFRSRTVRLQFKAKVGSGTAAIRYAILEWTGTADAVTSDVVNDWTSSTYTAGNFFNSTTLNVLSVGSTTVTTSFTDCSTTATVGASANNLIVFVWTEGTAAQNVTVDICEALLMDGASVRPWLPRPAQQELALCQRYYEKSMNVDSDPLASTSVSEVCYTGATWANSAVSNRTCFQVSKRASPTVTVRPFTTPTNTGRVSDAGGTDQAAGSGTVVAAGQPGFAVQNTSGGAITPAGNGIIYNWEADAEL